MPWITKTGSLTREDLLQLVTQSIAEAKKRICARPKKVLLLPPDITRAHSGSGWITEAFYNALSPEADVWVMPTLGQHVAHTPEENRWMFGSIPEDGFSSTTGAAAARPSEAFQPTSCGRFPKAARIGRFPSA